RPLPVGQGGARQGRDDRPGAGGGRGAVRGGVPPAPAAGQLHARHRAAAAAGAEPLRRRAGGGLAHPRRPVVWVTGMGLPFFDGPSTMKHSLNLWDLDGEQIRHLLQEAIQLKAAHQRGERPPLLAGRVLGLVFEKPSLRTRASFEAAMTQLGGSSVFLSSPDGALGVRESVPDFARTLSQYADAVVLRTFRHQTVEDFAAHSSSPVINRLSDP